MAYSRRRSSSSRRGSHRSVGSRSGRRVGSARRRTAVRRGSARRGQQTVRVVIEHAAASPVSRPDMIGRKVEAAPVRARF